MSERDWVRVDEVLGFAGTSGWTSYVEIAEAALRWVAARCRANGMMHHAAQVDALRARTSVRPDGSR